MQESLRQLFRRHVAREVDAYARLVNGPIPFRSRHVPVELVVAFETIDGALDAISDHVGKLPRDRPVGVSDADEETPVFGPGFEAQRSASAVRDSQDPQADGIGRPDRDSREGFRSGVPHGDGSKDAVPLEHAEVDVDGLGHEDRPIGVEKDRDVELADLDGRRIEGESQEPRQEKRGLAHGQSATLGAGRSPASAWKNERVSKPRTPARRLAGKTSCLVLKSRTTAL